MTGMLSYLIRHHTSLLSRTILLSRGVDAPEIEPDWLLPVCYIADCGAAPAIEPDWPLPMCYVADCGAASEIKPDWPLPMRCVADYGAAYEPSQFRSSNALERPANRCSA
ncbi:hypothetical protein ALC57_05185 [Trachymyrmex cornetzi]|uniref:Uncharacterized protein n=1 Tax=Trachymyrmex cornetzi TaxID=471704 RepID=A0A151JBC2_9HYME|nr:hypothetical protein ALC57_05185 [Trachymyrmex cornetzi]